ncbi:MAG TPA: O-acetyl-ADP-ribose deacetylase [Candidatus Deferrimicrobiaceae bacterium]|nr:O-acetyl-ADP-ribose deacetylase [Candidatus Deferrimicrobiaceae bacterium]
MEREFAGRKLQLAQGDITNESTDAIVNAANSSLLGGGGVDGAIHRAGGAAILEECKAIRARQGECPTGKAVITSGGRLAARFVIHTVGPVWKGGNRGEEALLASCYRSSLQLATENGVSSVSFPSVSTGIYGYPVKEAARVAIGAVAEFLENEARAPSLVRFVLFDGNTFDAYRHALQER